MRFIVDRIDLRLINDRCFVLLRIIHRNVFVFMLLFLLLFSLSNNLFFGRFFLIGHLSLLFVLILNDVVLRLDGLCLGDLWVFWKVVFFRVDACVFCLLLLLYVIVSVVFIEVSCYFALNFVLWLLIRSLVCVDLR